MHQARYYGQTEKAKIAQSIREEGFDPLLISDSPGHTYAPHSHPETKLLAFLGGCMEVSVLGTRFDCVSGDRLIIPGNTEHSAVVGSQGCEYFWSERLGGPLESPVPADLP